MKGWTGRCWRKQIHVADHPQAYYVFVLLIGWPTNTKAQLSWQLSWAINNQQQQVSRWQRSSAMFTSFGFSTLSIAECIKKPCSSSNITTSQTWKHYGVTLHLLCISWFCQLYLLVLSTVFVNWKSWATLIQVKLGLQTNVLILDGLDKPVKDRSSINQLHNRCKYTRDTDTAEYTYDRIEIQDM